MSKLARKPIPIPSHTEVVINNDAIAIKGKLGSLHLKLLSHVGVEMKEGALELKLLANHKQARANWGTMTALLKNALAGVNESFSKSLEIEGVGFNASMEGNTLVLKVGFSHPVKFSPPADIKVSVEKGVIKISGIDKSLVGETAAKIRSIKKPEPYKGKGIKYSGEIIRRKAGKKVAGVGVATAAQ